MSRKKAERPNGFTSSILSVPAGSEVHAGPSDLGNTFLGRNRETLTGRVLPMSRWRPKGVSDVALHLIKNPKYPEDPDFEVGEQCWFRRRAPSKGNKGGSWV